MKRIYNNSDIQINLKTISGITDKFIIKFFTTNKEFFIRKTNENVYTVDDEKYIKLNWSELKTIGDGVLNYVLNNIKDDTDYDDGEYNNTISRTTNYYICSNFKVDPETDKSISEIIAELTEKVDAEETARQNADTTLQTDLEEDEFAISAALNDLNSNKAEKEEINTLQSNLTTEIENETTARQNADAQLQSNINRKANIEDVFDKQTAISTFVTKTELQEILKKINGGEY